MELELYMLVDLMRQALLVNAEPTTKSQFCSTLLANG